MELIKSLTPENTEEIRPGFFLQRLITKNGVIHRQVKPLAWNGQWMIKEQLKTVLNMRTAFTIALILFIAWSYFDQTEYCRELQKDPCNLLNNITEYCYSNEYRSDKFGDNKIGWDDFAIQNNP